MWNVKYVGSFHFRPRQNLRISNMKLCIAVHMTPEYPFIDEASKNFETFPTKNLDRAHKIL